MSNRNNHQQINNRKQPQQEIEELNKDIVLGRNTVIEALKARSADAILKVILRTLQVILSITTVPVLKHSWECSF